MPFLVLQPPKDEAQFAELGKEIFEAAKGYGLSLNAEGFLLAWVGGTRVIVERTAEGQIAGLALVTIGKRWTHGDFTASVLFFRGTEQLFEFIKQIAAAMGASDMYHETRELQSLPDRTTYEITKYHLT